MNSEYVYYLTRGFIASTRAFNLLTCAFNLATRAFSLLNRGFELVTRGFELLTSGFEHVTHGFEFITCGFELVTRNSCFTFPRFDSRSQFLFTDRSKGKNVIIFGADISSSVHANNKNKNILILGKGETKGLHNIALTAEAECSINFTQSNRKFILRLDYNESDSFLSVNATNISTQNKIIRNKTISIMFR